MVTVAGYFPKSSSAVFFIIFVVSFFCTLTASTAATSAPAPAPALASGAGPKRLLTDKLSWKRTITVDQSGSGNHKTIQGAIDSISSNNAEPVLIRVEPGTYKEKIVVPEDKPWIILTGRNAATTIITYDDDSGDIHKSPTFTVFASNFVARYLTIKNTYGAGKKAVALRVKADMVTFSACRILSYQDTLLAEQGRQYYSHCHIEGAVDFIFGNSASVFENCHLRSISDGNGAITAQKRESESQDTGFYFVGCKITGIKSCVLGRPWGPYSRVVFADTYMSNVVLPEGWNDWGKASVQSTVYYGESNCSGPGSKRTGRVPWSRSLTSQQVAPFATRNAIDGKLWIRV